MAAAVARLARRVRRRSPRGIVLCYHRVAEPRRDPSALDVSPAQFDDHLRLLRSEARPLPLAAFEQERRAGRLPERAVAVTFDDGYADNLHVALPLLERHAVPATVFVTTGGVGAAAEFWWDELERGCSAPHELPGHLRIRTAAGVFAHTLDASACAAGASFDARRPLYDACKAWVRALPAPAQRDAMAQWRSWCGTDETARDDHRTLRVDELQALSRSPLVDIGGHSVTHPVLGALDAEAQTEECAASRTALLHWTGRAPAHFAYPFGDGAAVTRRAERAVRDAGYEAGFTTCARAAWRWNRAMAVPRIAMQAWDAAEFGRRLPLWFDE